MSDQAWPNASQGANDGLPPRRPGPPSFNRSGSSAKGIDIRDAMSILSSRAEAGGDAGLHDGSENVSDEQKSMGQTIDMFQWTGGGQGCECGSGAPADGGRVKTDGGGAAAGAPAPTAGQGVAGAAEEERRKELEEQRKTREAEIRMKLEQMTVCALLNAVSEAQRERTLTYQEYDRGLDTVLSTGNVMNYPSVCARATASFSVLSDAINTIGTVLSKQHGRKDLVKLIRDLQKHEKEKLSTTAALHLERIREKNEVGTDDDRIRQLLRDGVVSLRTKIARLIDAINETLEELRYAMAEEEE